MGKFKDNEREEITRSQVESAIKDGLERGIFLFRVTSHFSKEENCKPHEGKIYCSDPELEKYFDGPLIPENCPPYHSRCSHRIFPYVLTNRELFKKIANVDGEEIAKEIFLKKGLGLPRKE